MIRFLGAYRRLRFHDGQVTEGFDQWNLPRKSTGASSWLLATTLKYRGSLHAATQRKDAALRDFEKSLALLEDVDSPLLRLIGGSAALEAALRLPKSAGCTERFRVAALRFFIDSHYPSSAAWIDALETSAAEDLEFSTLNLRKFLRY